MGGFNSHVAGTPSGLHPFNPLFFPTHHLQLQSLQEANSGQMMAMLPRDGKQKEELESPELVSLTQICTKSK